MAKKEFPPEAYSYDSTIEKDVVAKIQTEANKVLEKQHWTVIEGIRFLPLVLTAALLIASTPALAETASFYGGKHHGRLTASGERFNQHAFTAAHRSLPFGTRVRVSRGSRSVVVRISDRGPFVKGRSIDLSYAAARQLGMIGKGVARVSINRL